jgi:glycosyltransferase involved in cell wall biosynthesis
VNRRIRVLHLIGDPGPFGYPFLSLLSSHIDRDRFELRFATVEPRGWLQEDAEAHGWNALSLDADGRKDYPRAVGRLTRYLLQEKVDVVHTHSLDASMIGLLAARAARRPVGVVTAHYPHETPLHNRRSLTLLDSLTLGRLAHGVVAPSRQMAETLIETVHVPARKVRVIEHGFDLDRFDPTRADGCRVRTELGLEGRLVLGAAGRFFWVKNQEGLVRAFAPVAKEIPEAVLLLVGSGDSRPVQQLARNLDVDAQVRTIPFRKNMPELLAAMDLFVHPALAESFGLVIVEAMAMGKPVLSTPVGVAPDLLADGEPGVLAPNGAAKSLEVGLRGALAQRDRWAEMGSVARSRAERFTVPRMVSGYEAFYEERISRFRVCAEGHEAR